MALGGCSGRAAESGPGPLKVEDVRFGITTTEADRAKTWIIGSLTICTENDPAILDSIEPIKAVGGVRIVRAGARAVINGEGSIASMPGPLPARYAPLAGYKVDVRCQDGPSKTTEIAIEVASPPAPTSNGIFGLRVRYHTDGDRHSVAWSGAEILMCNGTETLDGQLRDCANAPPESP